MLDALKAMLAQKKFLAALVALVAHAAARFGFQLDEAEIALLVGPLWLYILGQGVADHGKEAAVVNAKAEEVRFAHERTLEAMRNATYSNVAGASALGKPLDPAPSSR